MEEEKITIREFIESKLEALAIAVKLDKVEIQRRLDVLNHAHEQARDKEATYLPRELYEQSHKDLQKQIAGIQKLMYVGLGVLATLQFIIPIAITLLILALAG